MELEKILILISEECGEVVQAIAKAQRFGKDNFSPYNNDKSNLEKIVYECLDLLTVIDMLNKNLNVIDETIKNHMKNKIQKINKWEIKEEK